MVFILPVCLTWGPLHKSIKGPHLRIAKHSFGIFHPRKLYPVILWCMCNYLYTVVVGVLTFSFRMRHLNLLYWEEKQHTYLLTPCEARELASSLNYLQIWYYTAPKQDYKRQKDSQVVEQAAQRTGCAVSTLTGFEGPTGQALRNLVWLQCWPHALCMRLDWRPMEVASNLNDTMILLMF